MANWTGTYAITTAGTTPTATTSTTLTNTGASWPTSPSLANWYVRILTGPGAGTDTLIASNTATQITVSAWSGTQPTTGSTYELVLKLANGDAITGNFSVGNNCICELGDSAIITVNGNYSITMTGSCIVRWGKTETTYGTFQAQNRTTAQAMGAWTGITVNATGSLSVSYIKILDAVTPFTGTCGSAAGTGSVFSKLWIEGSAGGKAFVSSGTTDQNKIWSGVYVTASKDTGMTFSAGASAFTEVFDRFWFDINNYTALCTFANGGPTRQVIRDTVNHAQQNQLFDSTGGSSKYATVQDNYVTNCALNDGAIVMGNSSGTGTINYEMRRNTIRASRSGYGAGSSSNGTFASAFNDFIQDKWCGFRALAITNSTSYGTATSDNDYLAGTNGANKDNIDTSASTSSTATPSQYANLTASRTNAKAVRNKPLVCDNISVGTPTTSGATITFDCKNGVVAGQGSSTVTTDSSSGQKVVSTTDTTGFEVGEVVEIGYGTARQETGRIASISANTSITLEDNLTYTHTAAQADTIKKQLRHFGIPFIRYGTTSGVYTHETEVPPQSSWGPIFTRWQTTYNGSSVAFNKIGHSVTLSNLKAGTTYYIQACAYTPHGELAVSTETSFATAAAPSGGSFAFVS